MFRSVVSEFGFPLATVLSLGGLYIYIQFFCSCGKNFRVKPPMLCKEREVTTG